MAKFRYKKSTNEAGNVRVAAKCNQCGIRLDMVRKREFNQWEKDYFAEVLKLHKCENET